MSTHPLNIRSISLRHLLLTLLSLLVSAAIFVYLFSVVSWADLLEVVRSISLKGVLVFVCFSFGMSLFRTWRYAVLLRIGGFKPHSGALFLITLVRNLFSDLLPARLGTLVYVYLAGTRLGVSWSVATASFAYCFVFDILSLGVLIIGAAMATSIQMINPVVLVASGAVLTGCCYLVLLLLPLMVTFADTSIGRLVFVRPERFDRFRDWLHSLADQMKRLQKSGQMFRVLMLSLGVRCCKYMGLYVLLLALVSPFGYLHEDFPLSKVFFGITSAEMAASLPISGLAGFGAYEGAWSLVFQLLGYPEKIAILTSISHHLLTQVYGYLLGGVALLLLLTPLWRENRRNDDDQRMSSAGCFRFYGSLLTLTAALVLVGVWYVRGDAAGLEKGSGTAGVAKRETVSTPPEGWVVFQRPDGIHKVNSRGGEVVRLSDRGTWPRWSPEGIRIAFVDGRKVMLMNSDGTGIRRLAEAVSPRAVCFHPDGRSVLFTDKTSIKQVDIADGQVRELWRGNEFLELDISDDGKVVVATEKILFGYQVIAVETPTGEKTVIGKGCSASISAGDRYITINADDHRSLVLHNRQDKKDLKRVAMIGGLKFDNQFWSNHPDWFASKSEGEAEDIYLHHVPTRSAFQVTATGKNDRPDFYVLP